MNSFDFLLKCEFLSEKMEKNSASPKGCAILKGFVKISVQNGILSSSFCLLTSKRIISPR